MLRQVPRSAPRWIIWIQKKKMENGENGEEEEEEEKLEVTATYSKKKNNTCLNFYWMNSQSQRWHSMLI